MISIFVSRGEEVSSAIPSTRLEFASLCLRNALSLLNEFSASIKNGNNADAVITSLKLGAPHLAGLSSGLHMSSLGALGGPGATLGFGSGDVLLSEND